MKIQTNERVAYAWPCFIALIASFLYRLVYIPFPIPSVTRHKCCAVHTVIMDDLVAAELNELDTRKTPSKKHQESMSVRTFLVGLHIHSCILLHISCILLHM